MKLYGRIHNALMDVMEMRKWAVLKIKDNDRCASWEIHPRKEIAFDFHNVVTMWEYEAHELAEACISAKHFIQEMELCAG